MSNLIRNTRDTGLDCEYFWLSWSQNWEQICWTSDLFPLFQFQAHEAAIKFQCRSVDRENGLTCVVYEFGFAFCAALLEHIESTGYIHKWKSLFCFPNKLISTWWVIIISCAFLSKLEFIKKRFWAKFKHRHLWREPLGKGKCISKYGQTVEFVLAVTVYAILVA